MSWESSAEYYRLLNEGVRERLGGLYSARGVPYSVDFAEVEALQVAGRWAEAGELLAAAARSLEAAGADLVLLCTNTMDRVADEVQAAIGVPPVRAPGSTRGPRKPRPVPRPVRLIAHLAHLVCVLFGYA